MSSESAGVSAPQSTDTPAPTGGGDNGASTGDTGDGPSLSEVVAKYSTQPAPSDTVVDKDPPSPATSPDSEPSGTPESGEAQPADDPGEQTLTLEQAQRMLELAESDPDAFLKQHTKVNPVELRMRKLTQRDQDLVRREQELKHREEETSQALELKRLLAEDPYKAVQAMNLDFNRLAKQHLNDGKPDPYELITKLGEQVTALQGELKGIKETPPTDPGVAYRVHRWREDAERVLSGDDGAILRAEGIDAKAIEEKAVQWLEAHGGELLTPAQVAEKIRADVVSKHQALARLLGSTPAATGPQADTPKPTDTTGQAPATITAEQSGSATRSVRDLDDLDDNEAAVELLRRLSARK